MSLRYCLPFHLIGIGLAKVASAKGLLIALTASLLISACSQADLQEVETVVLEPRMELSRFEKAVASEARSPNFILRDQYRHPVQTLEFFQIKSSDTVVEIWPGGGWYTEILAPLLSDKGLLVAAHFPSNSAISFYARNRSKFDEKMHATPYINVKVSEFHPPKQLHIFEEGGADKVLTFRNVHNWMKNGGEHEAFAAFFTTLKSGGLLGVVEHRAKPNTDLTEQIKTGYVTEAYVKNLAQQAGFEFVAASEINANLKDTKNYANGVWSLPPSLRVANADRQLHISIGESDRMTLVFKKP